MLKLITIASAAALGLAGCATGTPIMQPHNAEEDRSASQDIPRPAASSLNMEAGNYATDLKWDALGEEERAQAAPGGTKPEDRAPTMKNPMASSALERKTAAGAPGSPLTATAGATPEQSAHSFPAPTSSSSQHRSKPRSRAALSPRDAATMLAFQATELPDADSSFGKWSKGVAHLFVMDCARLATGATSAEEAVAQLGLSPDIQDELLGKNLATRVTVPYAPPHNIGDACVKLAREGIKPECVADVMEINGQGRGQLFMFQGDQLTIDRVHFRCSLGRGPKEGNGAQMLVTQPYHLKGGEIESVKLEGVSGRAQVTRGSIGVYTTPPTEDDGLQQTGKLTIHTTLPVRDGRVEYEVINRPRR